MPTQDELTLIMDRSLSQLFESDQYLMNEDANERSICHRLAIYIQEQMPAWNVDCEYNRDGHSIKQTNLPHDLVPNSDEHARTVYPDIIVHHRGTSNNLLIIEVKKSSNLLPAEWDQVKLKSYCRPPLNYVYGLFLKIKTDSRQLQNWTFDWFQRLS